jgi:hypothetical protein
MINSIFFVRPCSSDDSFRRPRTRQFVAWRLPIGSVSAYSDGENGSSIGSRHPRKRAIAEVRQSGALSIPASTLLSAKTMEQALDNEFVRTAFSFLDLALAWLRADSQLIIEFTLFICLALLLVLLRRVASLQRLLRDVRWVNKP